MVNKKYILLAGVCSAWLCNPLSHKNQRQLPGQVGIWPTVVRAMMHWIQLYIPASRMEQQQQYLNHQYAFPAKPRNMWEFGINAGFYNVFGDVTSKTPFFAAKPLNSLGFGATLRKALGYSTSLRLLYNCMASGFDYRTRSCRKWIALEQYRLLPH